MEFKAFSSLEELYLNDNDIDDFVTTKGKIISKLYVHGFKSNSFFYMVCQMIIRYFILPVGSNNLGKLQVLDLGRNKFSARIFESLSTFPSLKILNLRGNNLEGSFTNEGKLYHSFLRNKIKGKLYHLH